MKAYELVGEVDEQHELRVQVPVDVPVGAVRVSIAVPDATENSGVQTSEAEDDDGWGALMRCIEENKMDTGFPDLAHEHDHYLHGTPKKGPA